MWTGLILEMMHPQASALTICGLRVMSLDADHHRGSALEHVNRLWQTKETDC